MATRKKSSKPFSESVRELLDEAEISQRELIRRTRRHGWGSTGTISFLMTDEMPPTQQAMEAIARALEVKPEHFAEWRLAEARRRLDPAVVGFKTALGNLE